MALTRRRFLQALGLSTLSITLPATGWAAQGRIPDSMLPQQTNVAGMVRGASRKPASRLLMLDAGHGGRDPGAIGRSGTYEKDVVLDICRQLANELSKTPGLQVRLTRDVDKFIPLDERVAIAERAKCDLFVSLHADSAPDTSARGLSAYTLSTKASDDFSKALAKKENLADIIGGVKAADTDPEVASILMDLTARHTKTASLKARMELIKAIDKGQQWKLLENPMRAANFAVLRAPDVPSMLIETGFLSNEKDEQILRDKANRQKIARLLGREFASILNSAPFV